MHYAIAFAVTVAVVIYLWWGMIWSHDATYGRRVQTFGEVPSIYSIGHGTPPEILGGADRIVSACLPWTGPRSVNRGGGPLPIRPQFVWVVGLAEHERGFAATLDGTLKRQTYWRAYGYELVADVRKSAP